MRFETINASQFLVWRLQYAHAVTHVRDEGDIILLTLRSGKRVMIHLYERGLNMGEVLYHFRTNTAQGIYTLLLPWVDMLLPSDGGVYEMPDWMRLLADLHGGKVYGYEVQGRDAWFFPIHFQGKGSLRTVRYGYVVDYGRISGGEMQSQHPELHGTWRVGGFEATATTGESAFSSTRDPLEAAYAVLGLTVEADLERVKQAYRMMARLYHPDVNTGDDALHRMQQINAAYQKILAQEEESHPQGD